MTIDNFVLGFNGSVSNASPVSKWLQLIWDIYFFTFFLLNQKFVKFYWFFKMMKLTIFFSPWLINMVNYNKRLTNFESSLHYSNGSLGHWVSLSGFPFLCFRLTMMLFFLRQKIRFLLIVSFGLIRGCLPPEDFRSVT